MMNFLQLSKNKVPYNQAKALILPVPCSGMSRGAQDMSKGPEYILQASQLLSDYDVETDTDLNELGLHTLDPLTCPENPDDMVEVLANQTSLQAEKAGRCHWRQSYDQ